MLLDTHTAVEQLDPAAPLAMLLHHFDLIVQTPADVDKLDAAILQLAVEGKLVTQDLSDEPAADLLTKIETARSQADNGVNSSRDWYKSVTERETPYTIPENWTWCRFGQIFDFQGGSQPPKSQFVYEPRDGYVRLLQIRDFGEDPVPTFVRSDSVTKFCSSEDIMIGRYGASIGKILTGHSGAYNVALVRVIYPTDLLDWGYVYYLLQSPLFQTPITASSRSAQSGFNKNDIFPLLIPLPPLAEQKRIVARVDELRRHTAALRAELAAAAQDAVTVNNAALNRLHTAADADAFDNGKAFAAAWQTLSDAFDPLYSVPQNLTALRQTILQLAVQGKLVPQDPNDEPATELIKRIEAEKKRLHKAGQLRKLEPFNPVRADETPYTAPRGWIWERTGAICNFIDYRGKTPQKTETGLPLVTAKNVRFGYFNPEPREYVNPSVYAKWMTRGIPEKGDILFTTEAPLGNVALLDLDGKVVFAQRIIILQPFADVNRKFLMYAFMSPPIQELIISKATGTTALGVSAGRFKPMPLPLPPLAEQERIVAKVDELLALCDLLEAELIEAEAVRVRVVDAVLAGV